MSDITPSRNIITVEETKFRAAVSESTMTRIGATNNFIHTYQHNAKEFFLNGRYYIGNASTGIDGMYPILFNTEIIAISMFNLEVGTSGTTTLDVHWYDGTGSDQGTIFSTKPSISSTASNGSYMIKDLITPTDFGGTGLTLPAFNKTTFNAGDALRLDLDSAMDNARTCGMIIYFRPIN